MISLPRRIVGLGAILCGFLATTTGYGQLPIPAAIVEGLPADSVAERDRDDDFDALLQRLTEAERRIQDLERQRVVVPPGPRNESNDADDSSLDPYRWSAPSRDFCADACDATGQEAAQKWYERFKVRGYTQFRFHEITRLEDGSAPPQYPGDPSVYDDQFFAIRRARLTLYGDLTDRMYFYFQPEFAASVPDSPDLNHYFQIRDLYADLYLDDDKVHRFRVGQSKVPYGWENMQSSSQRVPFDRNDAFNSGARNERDLGVFYYFTPVWTQQIFQELDAQNLKPSGNYGLFGFGAYNGQGGAFMEENDEAHLVARLTWPFQLSSGQFAEVGIQGYTGKYVVLGAPIRPLGQGPVDIIPAGTKQGGDPDGQLDQRLGWSFNWYPQPLGFQSEWTIGRGPALNAEQTAVDVKSLYGGYAMVLYKQENDWGTWFPYCRWQYFRGGYKSYRNAPDAEINEWEFGVEWQIRPECELTLAYAITDRTNLDPIRSQAVVSQESYRQFDGQFIRCQLQLNY